MVYKEFGATIAPSNVSSTGFPIAMGTHIGGGRVVNNKTTLNSKHWCLLGEGATLNEQKANAIGQIWYDTSDSKYWKLNSWASENPVWVDVSTIFATRSYVDDAIENIPDPMIFKGSLGTGGTITSLPTASNSNTGFTYKVITAGTYADQVAKVGDTFISDGTIWNLIPSGDDAGGTVTSITLDATSPILIDDSDAITTSGIRTFSHADTSGNKHIPSGGNSNNYLKWDSDGTATWSVLPTASTSVAGITTVGASEGAASYIHTHVKSDITDFDHTHGNITNDGAIGTTSGLMVKTTTSGVLTTLPAGSPGEFLQYDGTWATPTGTYSLPLASNGTRGGVQIGYTATGADLPLLLNSEKAYITLTSSSITTGLGYTPGTVTSVSTGTGLKGGPITTTGTIDLDTAYGDTVNPYASKTAKFVLAAPNAANGVPSFRALVASDILISSITFNDAGTTTDTSGTTYDGSTARTISYNTIGAAASSHTHGYMNDDGTITTNAIIANGDRILIADSDDGFKLKRTSIEFNTANRKFLREDGSWSDIPLATTSVDGLMTNTDKIKVNQLDLDSVLGSAVSNYDCLTVLDASDSYKMKQGPVFNGSSAAWYLSAKGTWETLKYRAIQVNSTGHVGPAVDNALNFVDGANTTMLVTSNLGVTSIQVNCNPISDSYTHRVLFSGKVSINPGTTSGTYTEGLRIGNASNGNSLIALGTDGSSLGVNNDGKQWHIMKLSTGELILTYDDSVNSGLTLEKNGSIKWRGAPLVIGSRIVSGVTSKTMEFNPEASNNFDIVLGENEKYIMPVHDPSMLISKDVIINLSTLGSEQDFSESEVTLEIPFIMHEKGDLNVIFESDSLNIFYNENFRLISELEGEGNMLYRIRYIEQMNRWSISSELFRM